MQLRSVVVKFHCTKFGILAKFVWAKFLFFLLPVCTREQGEVIGLVYFIFCNLENWGYNLPQVVVCDRLLLENK